MPDIRQQLYLTQQRLAAWLGVTRETLAQTESKDRTLPIRAGFPLARLALAVEGKVLYPDGTTQPAPPPLPAPDPRPLMERRLIGCRAQVLACAVKLNALPQRAACYYARLAAVPALRAWTGPVADPAQEESWLSWLAEEAGIALETTCGTGPQALLRARAAGLAREAEVLAELLAGLPPAP